MRLCSAAQTPFAVAVPCARPGPPGQQPLLALEESEMEAPLKGIRVLDFGMAAVGPISAEYMGFLGADVIKIESPSGDIVRRGKGGAAGWGGHTFLGNNIGK